MDAIKKEAHDRWQRSGVVCEELIYSLVALIFPWPSLQHSYDLELTDYLCHLLIYRRAIGWLRDQWWLSLKGFGIITSMSFLICNLINAMREWFLGLPMKLNLIIIYLVLNYVYLIPWLGTTERLFFYSFFCGQALLIIGCQQLWFCGIQDTKLTAMAMKLWLLLYK
jgi:hypothetical protein